MKKIFQIVIICTLYYSCGTLKIEQTDLVGEYHKHQTAKNALSINYNLVLKSDKTFNLSIKVQDANPECNGKWEYKDNYVYLKCDDIEDAIIETLSSGYMKERDYKLEVINRNKIRFKDDVILKRKNSSETELVHEAIHSKSN